MSEIEPSTNGSNGDGQRGPDGRFLAGNKGGGNPHVARIAELRASLLGAVTPADITAIVAKLVDLAKAGDVDAARLVLDRVFGKALQPVIAESEIRFGKITLDGPDLADFSDDELMKIERAFSGRTSARLPDIQPPALPAE